MEKSGAEARVIKGVKVFSATKHTDREEIGERVERWLKANSDLEVIDCRTLQSSDNNYHCLSVVLLYC